MAAIKSLPLILQLIQQFKSSIDAKVERGIGHDAAVADGLKLMMAQYAEADAAVEAARANQATHPNSDEGRDKDFRRD